MAGKGPPRQPTAKLAARGSWLAKTRAKSEPETVGGESKCPKWLDAEGRKWWKHFYARVSGMRVMTPEFEVALDKLAWTAAYYFAGAEQINREGRMVDDGEGRMVLHPLTDRVFTAGDKLEKYLIQFGLTPASLSTVTPRKEPSNKAGALKFVKTEAS